MIKSLAEIVKLRKKFRLNQKELALKAGVSQSLIAKIEAGKVDPTFTKAQQIFTALEELQEQHELKAKDLLNSKVIFVDQKEPIREVIKKMKAKGISQVPVLAGERICGLVTESVLLNTLLEKGEKISGLTAKDVMEDAPPIVTLKAGIHSISELLVTYPIVLVAEKGEIKGIISKADLLGRME